MSIFTKKTDYPFTIELTPKELYQKLETYYNNNPYEQIETSSHYSSQWLESMKPIRTVVNRSVEFYVSKLLPGEDVQISAKNQSVKESIEQFYKWSNFGSQKQLAVRQLSLFGDLFLKVVGGRDKVYSEIIKPEFVTDFKTDNRGFLTEIRIDIPTLDEDNHPVTYTEYWNKTDGYYSIWYHRMGDANLDQLGDPESFGYLSEMGIDFIPIVHIKFRDTGDLRGKACVTHALNKIDEANREATRLAEMLFKYNKPLWAVSANQVDKDGRPIPAPLIKKDTNAADLEVKDNSIIYLPGMSTLTSLIPNINYDSALNILNAMVAELREDLPELNYYALKDASNLSGKAIKLLLAGALDKANEARSNFLQGLIRLDEMALTIGRWFGLFPVTIGSYQNGDFEHSILAPDFVTKESDETATTLKLFIESGLPLPSAMRLVGFSEEEVVTAMKEKAEIQSQNDSALAQSLMKFNAS